MLSLIIGGSGSGKSAYAEQMLSELNDVEKKYYLATMQVFDEDGRTKVKRHREMRRGKGFLTIEQAKDVLQALPQMTGGEKAVLLECMSNLTANEMFGAGMRQADEVAEKVLHDIAGLMTQVRHMIIVTNNVFEDGNVYDRATEEYRKALGEINRSLARQADRVVEVTAGIPGEWKSADEHSIADYVCDT